MHEFNSHNSSNKSKNTIAIISTTGKIKPFFIPEIQNYYQKFGYKVVFGHSCFKNRKLDKQDDKFRALELMAAVEDSAVAAVIFARGGEFSERIIPYLKIRAINKNPKIFIGFSDLTSILSYLSEKTKAYVYHGPMAVDVLWDGMSSIKYLNQILKGKLEKIFLKEAQVLTEGEAKGILKGGCLSVINKLIDGNYAPSFHNSILFIEDINESVDTIYKMLKRLKTKRKLSGIKGIIFGEMYNCRPRANDFWCEFTEIIKEMFSNYSIPIGFNVKSGHGSNELYLPFGTRVKLVLDKNRSYISVLNN